MLFICVCIDNPPKDKYIMLKIILKLILISKYSNPFKAVVISKKPLIIFFNNKLLIGNKLTIIRKSLGLTQQQIADECSISQPTYNTYEKGLYLVSTMTVYTICKNHNISMSDVFKISQ